jgi:hypothetical protein
MPPHEYRIRQGGGGSQRPTRTSPVGSYPRIDRFSYWTKWLAEPSGRRTGGRRRQEALGRSAHRCSVEPFRARRQGRARLDPRTALTRVLWLRGLPVQSRLVPQRIPGVAATAILHCLSFRSKHVPPTNPAFGTPRSPAVRDLVSARPGNGAVPTLLDRVRDEHLSSKVLRSDGWMPIAAARARSHYLPRSNSTRSKADSDG